jgi:hypothetical protein
MKKTFTLIGVAALLATVSFNASAQMPIYANQTISLPSVIPVANSPTNFATPFFVDVSKQNVVRFSFAVQSADASSTTNVTFKAAWTSDGSTFDTNNSVTLTACTLAGITCVTTTNVLTSNGAKGLFIWQESIGANSQVTNRAASYGVKISAP